MRGTLKKLKKLRGRSLAELRVRGAQAAAAFAERRGWSRHARLPADAEFFRRLAAPFDARPSAERLLEHFRERGGPRFFASFDDAAETAAAWRAHFGAAAEAELVARAERITAGRFDLLGFRDLRFDKQDAGGRPQDGDARGLPHGDRADRRRQQSGDADGRPSDQADARPSDQDAARVSRIDWHLEPVSGKRAPLAHWSRIEYLNAGAVGDKKITWELNRHQHFLTLGRAYLLTRDERYAETFAAHLASWAEDNPVKLGINWASSLEVAFRSISWLWALHFFRRSPHLSPRLFLLALKLLDASARHVETYLSTYFSPNTHLTGEALGLFYAGLLLPELRDAARWRETGLAIMRRELSRHVRPDGVYFEQSSYYHRYTTDFYTHLLLLARRNDLKLDRVFGEKLTALVDHLMFITRPDGRSPLYGDDDGGRLAPLDSRERDDFRAALSTAAAHFGRADHKFVAGELAEETLWLLGPRGAQDFAALEARPPAETSRAFPAGGYYVMRDGWRADANYLLLDCGPHGEVSGAHAHADALSFELAARGRALLIDPGTYTYTASAAERDRFRSTSAHNTVTVDGEPSSVPGDAFNWRQAARPRARTWAARPRFDYFEGEHDGYRRLARPATHRRAALFLKGDYFVLRDRIEGAGARRCELYFHFAPGARPACEPAGANGALAAVRERAGDGAHSAGEGVGRDAAADNGAGGVAGSGDASAAGLEIFACGGGGAWRVEEGFVSRSYGARERAAVAVFAAEPPGAAEFYTFLVPGAGAGTSVRRIEATGGQLFEVSRAGASHSDVLLVSAGAYVESGRLASDFEWTWARFSGDGSTLEELVLVNGRRFSLYGREIVRLSNRAPYATARRDGERLLVEAGKERKVIQLGQLLALSS